uniref:Nucleoredoxin like 2 n=1 Tax=Cyanistes caeruleus TaxID=156563 RepID=A0A8C0UN71_CYACU
MLLNRIDVLIMVHKDILVPSVYNGSCRLPGRRVFTELARTAHFCKMLLMVCFILNFFPLSDLKKKYNITAIPKLVIVKQTGEVITDKGRKQIRDKGLSCFRNWLEGADIFQNFSN